jgi:VanZ family protein
MRISKWLPSLLVMLVIFLFSAQPSSSLPSFDWADRIVKKGGHVLGYALLAWTYWHGFDYRKDKRWLSWLFAVLYAVTDELHQSLVPGRRASLWDVVVFDNLGALISLWLIQRVRRTTRTT